MIENLSASLDALAKCACPSGAVPQWPGGLDVAVRLDMQSLRAS